MTFQRVCGSGSQAGPKKPPRQERFSCAAARATITPRRFFASVGQTIGFRRPPCRGERPKGQRSAPLVFRAKPRCATTRPRYITLKKAAMRTISKRTQYGLKAMLALGKRYGEGPVRMATIAAEESIPLKFLEIILLDLKGNGLLESKTGKRGGYLLSRPR